MSLCATAAPPTQLLSRERTGPSNSERESEQKREILARAGERGMGKERESERDGREGGGGSRRALISDESNSACRPHPSHSHSLRCHSQRHVSLYLPISPPSISICPPPPCRVSLSPPMPPSSAAYTLSTVLGNRFFLTSFGALYFSEVQKEDALSTYRCITKHKYSGETRQSNGARLSVMVLDSFQSGEVQMGHSVELPCVASGYPNPTIRWLKDGRPLPADSRWTRRITGLTVSDLRLEDSGNYICEVTNSFGSKEVTGHLNVIGAMETSYKLCWLCPGPVPATRHPPPPTHTSHPHNPSSFWPSVSLMSKDGSFPCCALKPQRGVATVMEQTSGLAGLSLCLPRT
ncbi:hypothetical protein F7725_020741 [Dissostichus mawsoni]|uniref:Ig-like domain-containing protein n=1 Tax=Dissostichus mawsoni TaxID=36200 RepID=A0A7J5YF07_DISMA|nr:hypothetical protein F7725_020741 [Dissostichus mawsoni]